MLNENLALSELLAYTHPQVVKRYEKDYPRDNKWPATQVFTELLKYFWLCHQHKLAKQKQPAADNLDFTCLLHEEMQPLDNMWHTFLLFTQDYQRFCERYFGDYLHHVPIVDSDPVLPEQRYVQQLERYLNYIYDHLGEETVRKWFE